MKKTYAFLTALLVMAVLFASCSNGGGSGESEAPVKVSFIIDTPHSDVAQTAGVNNSTAGYEFYYAAIPQWTGSDFSAQGATGGTNETPTYAVVPGNNNATYSAGSQANLGYFSQGSWIFYAQVRKAGTNTVVYQGNTGKVYINGDTATHTIVINVARNTSAGTATVTVDIEVPNVSDATTLTATYNGGSITLSKYDYITDSTDPDYANNPTNGTGWSRFIGSGSLATGSYTFTLTSKDGSTPVGGSVLAFDIIPGENRTISGTIENGEWQTILFTINVPTLDITLAGASSVTHGVPTIFTCTATATQLESTDSVTYEWFVGTSSVQAAAAGTQVLDENEDPIPNQTRSTYSFNQANPGDYYVTCVAKVAGKKIASKTAKIRVN